MEGELRIVVKWSGKEYDILDIQEEDTVLALKERIHRETGVRPERQKLLNLKFKGYVLNCFDRSLNFDRSLTQSEILILLYNCLKCIINYHIKFYF